MPMATSIMYFISCGLSLLFCCSRVCIDRKLVYLAVVLSEDLYNSAHACLLIGIL